MIRINQKQFDLVIPGEKGQATLFCAEQFMKVARSAIEERGKFTVALAGGSTPIAVYQLLSTLPQSKNFDWSKVYLFWGDERAVPPVNSESNFYSSMEHLMKLPIPQNQIFRMQAENNMEQNAQSYENLVLRHTDEGSFDLVLLGVGTDGHTASLFPDTKALSVKDTLVCANLVPQLDTKRMTLTYKALSLAKNIHIYTMGSEKSPIVQSLFSQEVEDKDYPVLSVQSEHGQALWILDKAAGAFLHETASS